MTPPDYLGFSGSVIDRSANHRGDPDWLAAQWRLPEARMLRLHGDRARVADERLVFEACSGTGVLLGRDEIGPIFTQESKEEFAESFDLRSIAAQGLVTPPDQALLAQARSILLWHQKHGFCSNCGCATAMEDAGYRRHCQDCGTDHFPRTDPVIIIAVRSKDRLLLGRQASWPPGLYSALAGFMEPGETIEEAAAREVKEETGVTLASVRYLKSQPWPFPSSLMIGLTGEAAGDSIEIDRKELEDARWFSRDELTAMGEGRHPGGLRHPVPMAIAYHLIRAAMDI